MTRHVPRLLSGLLLTLGAWAQPEALQCRVEHVVRAGESLSAIAEIHLGDPQAYLRIVDAGNADASDRFHAISDPARIVPGWRLCLEPAEAPAVPLTGTVWRWSRLRGAETLDVPRPARYTLRLLENGQYRVRADCNTIRGTYEIDNLTLTLEPGAMTRSACGPGSLSDRFTRLLDSPADVIQDGKRLQVKMEGHRTLEFAAEKIVELPGTSWLVRAYNNGKQAVVRVAAGTSLRASFGEDGMLSGSSGCNKFSAPYDPSESGLGIGAIRSTRMMCGDPAGVMEQERAFIDALAMTAGYRLEGRRLQLLNEGRALAVDFVSAVTGTLTYDVQHELPAGATVRVELQDVSLADAPAALIGEQSLTARGEAASMPFEVVFNPADIDPRHTYSLRATIADSGGGLLFTTTQAHLVITRSNPTFDVAVELRPAR